MRSYAVSNRVWNTCYYAWVFNGIRSKRLSDRRVQVVSKQWIINFCRLKFRSGAANGRISHMSKAVPHLRCWHGTIKSASTDLASKIVQLTTVMLGSIADDDAYKRTQRASLESTYRRTYLVVSERKATVKNWGVVLEHTLILNIVRKLATTERDSNIDYPVLGNVLSGRELILVLELANSEELEPLTTGSSR